MSKPIITVLDNGLTVIVEENKNINSVIVALGVEAGSKNETINQGGIAHFLEHMNFKGTEKRDVDDIMESIESVGGSFNAYTSNETTVYYARILKEHLELGVDVITDMVLNSVYPESEFKKEKDVVIKEIEQYKDSPSSVVMEKLSLEMFPNQSLGRPILGREEQIESYTTDDLRKFRDDYYIPSNMIMSVSGNVKNGDVIKFAKKYFMANRNLSENIKVVYIEEEKYNNSTVLEHKEDLNQSIVAMMWKITDNITFEQNIKNRFLANLFGGGMSSRLFKHIREDLGLVYSVSSGYMHKGKTGLFYITGGTSLEKVNEFLHESCNLLKRLKGTINKKEFTTSLNKFKMAVATEKESVQSIASNNLSELQKYGKIHNEDEVMDIINNIKIEDLDDIIDDILEADITLGVIGNFNNDISTNNILETKELKNLLK